MKTVLWVEVCSVMVTMGCAAATEPCPPGSEKASGRCVPADADAGMDSDSGTPCEGDTFFPDTDGDGFGDEAATDVACEPREGWALDGSDCDDEDAAVHPGTNDPCNGVDDDCDGTVDQAHECAQGEVTACVADCGTAGSSTCKADCTPGTCVPPAERCNGIDEDCDGSVDEEMYEVRGSVQLGGAGDARGPDVAWTGDRWFVAWEGFDGDRPNVRTATVEDDVASVPDGFLFDAAIQRPRVGRFGDRVAVSAIWWNEMAPWGLGFATTCVVDPAVAEGIDVEADCAMLSNRLSSPASQVGMAGGDDVLAVGFIDDASGTPDARVSRVNADSDEVGVEATLGSASWGVNVAYDSANDRFAVVWDAGGQVWFARVFSDGATDGVPAPITAPVDGPLQPAIAWGDPGGLVAWLEDRGGGVYELRTQRLGADGNLDGDPVDLGAATVLDGPAVDVAWTGGEYVIAHGGGEAGTDEIRVTRLGAAGAAETFVVNAEGSRGAGVAIDWNGDEIGVAWTDDSSGADDAHFARVTCQPE